MQAAFGTSNLPCDASAFTPLCGRSQADLSYFDCCFGIDKLRHSSQDGIIMRLGLPIRTCVSGSLVLRTLVFESGW